MTQAIVTRYASSVTLGAAITLSLLLLMQHLIATGENPFVSSAEYRFVPFGRVRPPVPPEPRPIPPVKPKPPVKPPDVQRIESGSNGKGPPVQFVPQPPGGPGPINPTGVYRSGPALALVMVAPAYPARAAARGLEGYVIVEFTVTALGTVADVIVTDSSNVLFDRYAIDAAYKFKYKPQFIDGVPVDSHGMRNKFTFVLEN